MKNYLILAIYCLSVGCIRVEGDKKITSWEDYHVYLPTPDSAGLQVHLADYSDEMDFWRKKIENQPNGFIYIQKLAALRAQQFLYTGDVSDIDRSDSLLLLASSMVHGKFKMPVLLALSSNAVKKHQFTKALDYCLKARGLADDQFATNMMMYDAYMELGEFEMAESILLQYKNVSNFDYWVRSAKYLDHQGNLDSAITVMEKAYKMVKNEKGERALWATANLADMYGHSSKIEKSYRYFLKVLSKKPDYLYALRGIAWIAYAHDHKADEAIKILKSIHSKNALPDVHLLLAELYDYKSDAIEKEHHLNEFISEASQPKYREMYNAHLAALYAEEFRDYDKALQLANREVKNRPTPLMYDLLAWVYFRNGERQKALEIANEHVLGKTFEPEAMYHLGLIYASNGFNGKALTLLEEAHDASFELGPLKSKEIRHVLSSL